MTKGQEQTTEAAAICRQMSVQLNTSQGGSEGASLAARLEAQAVRLEGLQHRLFLKMAAAVRHTEPCLAAAREAQTGLAAGVAASDVETKVQALEAAVAALEAKAMSPGSIVIT